jgi:hypothetical protein
MSSEPSPQAQVANAPPVEPAPILAPARTAEAAKDLFRHHAATVRENLLPTEPLTPKLPKAEPVAEESSEPAAMAEPAAPPVVAAGPTPYKTPAVAAPVAVPVAAPVAVPAPKAPAVVATTPITEAPTPAATPAPEVANAAWPAPLPGAASLPPSELAALESPAPATAPKADDKPMPIIPPTAAAASAVTPVAEMPVQEIATPKVHIPHDLPLPSETGQAMPESRAMAQNDVEESAPAPRKNVATKTEPAPQFMSKEERTRELYRLAREMEDTFIAKLAH